MILRLRADDDGIFQGPDEVAHRFIGLIRYVDREDSSPNSRRTASFITEAIDAT